MIPDPDLNPHATSSEHGVLPYRNLVEVGSLAIQRHAGGITVTQRRMRDAYWSFGQAIFVLLLGAGLAWYGVISARTPDRGGWLTGIIMCAVFVLANLVHGIAHLFPRVFELDNSKVTIRVRTFTRMIEEIYHRKDFASVTIERLRLKNEFKKREGVTLVYHSGFSLIIFRGKHLENTQFASLISDIWEYESKPSLQTLESLKLPWGVKRRTIGTGFVITFAPRVPWLIMLITAIAVAIPASYLGRYVDDGRWHMLPRKIGIWQWVVVTTLVEVFVVWAIWALIKSLKRTTAVHQDAERLVVVETGLRPCHATYPATQIRSVVHNTVRRQVEICLADGSVVSLLQNGPKAHRNCALHHLEFSHEQRMKDAVLLPVSQNSNSVQQ